MIFRPIVPIFLMIIICVSLFILVFRTKNKLRLGLRIILIISLFALNLRPSLPNGEIITGTTNLNIVFAIDTTVSMTAEDYNGNLERWDGVASACEKIIDKLPGNYAVITFDNSSSLKIPFTSDSNAVLDLIESKPVINSLYAKGGSLNSVKEVLEKTLKRSSSDSGKKTILFLLSDGENTKEERLESFSNLSNLVNDGAVLGFGTEAGGKMQRNYFYDENEVDKEYVYDWDTGGDAISKIDEQSLNKIASEIGVDYFHIKNDQTLSELDKKLTEIAKEIEMNGETTEIGYEEYYYLIAGIITILLILELIFCRRERM